MKLTPTVNLDVQPAIYFALGVAHAVRSIYAEKPLIVTSANDSHVTKLHPKGLAFDMRTRDMEQGESDLVLARLKQIVEPLGYDVVDERGKLEGPHIHVEYDPKDSERFYTVL